MDKDFNSLDLYDKLIYISYTCYEVKTDLERIVDELIQREYIDEILNKLELLFPSFLDEEVNREENFDNLFRSYQTNVKEIMEIVPFIKKREASYKYLITMLRTIIEVIEETLPENLRIARFFKKLLNNKTRIAETLGVDENIFADIMDKMLKKSDSIMDIIDHNQEDKKRI